MKKTLVYNIWKKFIEEYNEYFINNEEKWLNKLKQVKKYFDDNKKYLQRVIIKSYLDGYNSKKQILNRKKRL